jgi:DNA-binding IclR family transcriptional regulator
VECQGGREDVPATERTFPEIIEFLKAAKGPVTQNDVIERFGVTPSSAFRTLSVLAKDGLVRVTHHREGAHHWDTYTWVESSAPIPFRHRRNWGSGTFHHY